MEQETRERSRRVRRKRKVRRARIPVPLIILGVCVSIAGAVELYRAVNLIFQLSPETATEEARPEDSQEAAAESGDLSSRRVSFCAVGDNLISLSGSQDVLGTWFATRTLKLTPYDRFEFNDAGLWMRSLDDYEGADDDLWEFAALTVTQSLPYADEHHRDQTVGTLEPGDRILIYASDKKEFAYFASQDGASGALNISPNYEQGWGWLVDGIPEEECFETVPYAD